jgi:hypothetical protein
MSIELAAALADFAAGGALAGTEQLAGLDGSTPKTWLLSQIATYVGAIVTTGLLDLKGSTNCSANPNYPAASKGDTYIVSVAGKIGGASGKSVDVGDIYIASADNAGGTEASVGASWFVIEHNLAGALLAANNLSDLADAETARANLGLARKYLSGRYYLPDGYSTLTTSASAIGANTLALSPFYLHDRVAVATLTARVTTSAAGNFQIYVYAEDATSGQPTGAPIASTAAISTASAAMLESAVSHTFEPGKYWAGAICDNATAVFAGPASNMTGFSQLAGQALLANAITATLGYTVAATYGSPPTLTGNPVTDGLALVNTAKFPAIGFKVA